MFKIYYSGLFYSSSTLKRVSSFLKRISQTINLAGSYWVPLFPELLLSVLHSIKGTVSRLCACVSCDSS